MRPECLSRGDRSACLRSQVAAFVGLEHGRSARPAAPAGRACGCDAALAAVFDTVAGADVSYDLRGKWLYAAVVVLRAETWEVIDRSGVVAEARFPYVPGLLSFRESPAVIEAFAGLKVQPDVLICDGQGIAHPRRLGLASHLGLWSRDFPRSAAPSPGSAAIMKSPASARRLDAR